MFSEFERIFVRRVIKSFSFPFLITIIRNDCVETTWSFFFYLSCIWLCSVDIWWNVIFRRWKKKRIESFNFVTFSLFTWMQMTSASTSQSNSRLTTDLIKKRTMPKLLSCLGSKIDRDDDPEEEERKRLARQNKKINAVLKRDGKIFKDTYRLLLLGE